MASLQSLFGSSAIQTATAITISKSDLDALVPGYTPQDSDSGDELAAAILYLLGQTATESARATDATRRFTCTYAGYDVVSRSGLPDSPYDRRDLFTAIWYTPQPQSPFMLD